MTIEELLQSEDISKVVSELRNGRLSVEPNTKEHVAQYDPKMHDINDTQKRPDKLVVIDKDSDEYGEVKNVNPNVEQTTEQGFRIEPVARIALAIQKLIVKRAVAFTFGNPVTYGSNPEGEDEKALLKAINRAFHDVKEKTLNRRIARSLYSMTEVAELWYPRMSFQTRSFAASGMAPRWRASPAMRRCSSRRQRKMGRPSPTVFWSAPC